MEEMRKFATENVELRLKLEEVWRCASTVEGFNRIISDMAIAEINNAFDTGVDAVINLLMNDTFATFVDDPDFKKLTTAVGDIAMDHAEKVKIIYDFMETYKITSLGGKASKLNPLIKELKDDDKVIGALYRFLDDVNEHSRTTSASINHIPQIISLIGVFMGTCRDFNFINAAPADKVVSMFALSDLLEKGAKIFYGNIGIATIIANHTLRMYANLHNQNMPKETYIHFKGLMTALGYVIGIQNMDYIETYVTAHRLAYEPVVIDEETDIKKIMKKYAYQLFDALSLKDDIHHPFVALAFYQVIDNMVADEKIKEFTGTVGLVHDIMEFIGAMRYAIMSAELRTMQSEDQEDVISSIVQNLIASGYTEADATKAANDIIDKFANNIPAIFEECRRYVFGIEKVIDDEAVLIPDNSNFYGYTVKLKGGNANNE